MNLVEHLQRLHDDQVIGARELAVLLHTTEAQVYKLSSTAPARLPPRLKVFGRKLAWRVGTCRAWVRAQDSMDTPATAGSAKRLGRPRAA